MKKPMRKKSLYLSNDADGNLIIHLNSRNSCKISENVEFITKLLYLMDGTLDIDSILVKVKELGYNITKENLLIVIDMFYKRNFIEDNIEFDVYNLTDEELQKYNRQLNAFALYGNNTFQDALMMQYKLKSKHICIIGLGGVGSHALYGFAAMGVGKITGVDFDRIELSNTSRQMLYSETDIGRYKIDVAKEKIEKVNPRVRYNFFNKKIACINDVIEVATGVDLIFLCADTPRGEIIDIVDEASEKLNIPYYVGSPTTDYLGCVLKFKLFVLFRQNKNRGNINKCHK